MTKFLMNPATATSLLGSQLQESRHSCLCNLEQHEEAKVNRILLSLFSGAADIRGRPKQVKKAQKRPYHQISAEQPSIRQMMRQKNQSFKRLQRVSEVAAISALKRREAILDYRRQDLSDSSNGFELGGLSSCHEAGLTSALPLAASPRRLKDFPLEWDSHLVCTAGQGTLPYLALRGQDRRPWGEKKLPGWRDRLIAAGEGAAGLRTDEIGTVSSVPSELPPTSTLAVPTLSQSQDASKDEENALRKSLGPTGPADRKRFCDVDEIESPSAANRRGLKTEEQCAEAMKLVFPELVDKKDKAKKDGGPADEIAAVRGAKGTQGAGKRRRKQELVEAKSRVEEVAPSLSVQNKVAENEGSASPSHGKGVKLEGLSERGTDRSPSALEEENSVSPSAALEGWLASQDVVRGWKLVAERPEIQQGTTVGCASTSQSVTIVFESLESRKSVKDSVLWREKILPLLESAFPYEELSDFENYLLMESSSSGAAGCVDAVVRSSLFVALRGADDATEKRYSVVGSALVLRASLATNTKSVNRKKALNGVDTVSGNKSVNPTKPTKWSSWLIQYLAVDYETQRQGVGSWLIGNIVQSARSSAPSGSVVAIGAQSSKWDSDPGSGDEGVANQGGASGSGQSPQSPVAASADCFWQAVGFSRTCWSRFSEMFGQCSRIKLLKRETVPMIMSLLPERCWPAAAWKAGDLVVVDGPSLGYSYSFPAIVVEADFSYPLTDRSFRVASVDTRDHLKLREEAVTRFEVHASELMKGCKEEQEAATVAVNIAKGLEAAGRKHLRFSLG